MTLSNTLFEDAKHSVWDFQTQCFASQNMQISASKVLFDNFNTYRRLQILHNFTLSGLVPNLFCKFFPVKIFHHFSAQRKILHILAHFLQDGLTAALTTAVTALSAKKCMLRLFRHPNLQIKNKFFVSGCRKSGNLCTFAAHIK